MRRIRTFIAVEMPQRVIARALALVRLLQETTDDVSWVRQQQMHLTLKFLGEVSETELPDVCRVVREAAAEIEPFEVTLRGAGAFPAVETPRTLWIGIREGAEELRALQGAIDTALHQELGFPHEKRGYRPHLTIGRLKRDTGGRGELAHVLRQHDEYDADLAVVDEVVTYASFLGRAGAAHDALDHAELGVRRPAVDAGED